MAGNFIGNLIGTFDGQTPAEIIAEARNGLAVEQALNDRINEKMDVHEHPYLGENSTAVNSTNLENKTRQSIIDESRLNLATVDELSNGLNEKLGKSEQAQNSVKVGGYGVSQIINEARSGTSANALKVKNTDLPTEILKDIQVDDKDKLIFRNKTIDYFGKYAQTENVQLPRMLSFDKDYTKIRFKKLGDIYILGYAEANEIVFYQSLDDGETWKRIINASSSSIAFGVYDFAIGEAGEFCVVYIDETTKFPTYVEIDVPNNSFKNSKILSEDNSVTNSYTQLYISEQIEDGSFCIFYNGKNDSYTNNIGLYYQYFNGAFVNETNKWGLVEVVSYDFAEGGNQVHTYIPPISDDDGFIIGYTIDNGTSTLAKVTGFDSYLTEAINTADDKIIYYRHIGDKIWFITDAGFKGEAVGYLLKSTFSDIQFQTITKNINFTRGCQFISDDSTYLLSKENVSINNGELVLSGLSFVDLNISSTSFGGGDYFYIKPNAQTPPQLVSYKEIEKAFRNSES